MKKKTSKTVKKKTAKTAAVANVEAPQEPQIGKWTFLTNHAHVLASIHADPDLVLRKVALQVGITERAVQRIVQDLEEAGYIQRERVGRRNTYEVLLKQPLRHPIESHRNIGELLSLVSE